MHEKDTAPRQVTVGGQQGPGSQRRHDVPGEVDCAPGQGECDGAVSTGGGQPAGIPGKDEVVVVTGASGFIGSWVVQALLLRGFNKVRCVTRRSGGRPTVRGVWTSGGPPAVEVIRGNLLSVDTCRRAVDGAAVVYHLAAGTEKTFPGCFLNSVVTTRNLLEAVVSAGTVRRFVNTSSLSVYSNANVRRGAPIDEHCEIDSHLAERHDAYAYGKSKQDELVREYGRRRGVPFVIVRPGVTFGPGKAKIPGRVGIDTFGIFLHLGLANRLPLTYVENCAEAIVLAGLRPGIEGQVINVVDDDLPRSWEFLRGYKRQVRWLTSIPVPYPVFYMFNALWEAYCTWSDGQLPPVFNRRTCRTYYRGQSYPNARAKELLGWSPRVPMGDALRRFYEDARRCAGAS